MAVIFGVFKITFTAHVDSWFADDPFIGLRAVFTFEVRKQLAVEKKTQTRSSVNLQKVSEYTIFFPPWNRKNTEKGLSTVETAFIYNQFESKQTILIQTITNDLQQWRHHCIV